MWADMPLPHKQPPQPKQQPQPPRAAAEVAAAPTLLGTSDCPGCCLGKMCLRPLPAFPAHPVLPCPAAAACLPRLCPAPAPVWRFPAGMPSSSIQTLRTRWGARHMSRQVGAGRLADWCRRRAAASKPPPAHCQGGCAPPAAALLLLAQVLMEARANGSLLPPQHRAVQAVRRVGMRVAQVGSPGAPARR